MKLASIAGAAGLILTLTAVAVLPASQLAAQETTQEKAQEEETFTKEHLRAAAAVVQTAQAAEGIDEILPVVAESARALFLRSNPELTAQMDEIVTGVAIKMAAKRPEVDRLIYEVWARRFTIEELVAINDFYKSPVGKKLAKMSPEVTALTVGAFKKWEQQLGTEMLTAIRAEIARIKTEEAKK